MYKTDITHPALSCRGEELWVVGGLDKEYNVQATTQVIETGIRGRRVVGRACVQVLDTLTMTWRWGPTLRQPRRGAFGWVQEGR